MSARAGSLPAALRAARLSLSLLAGRRLWLFAAADAVALVWGLLTALVAGGEPAAVYRGVVLLPLVLLALPLAGDALAVERRAGCLEVALAAPRAEVYFLRRVAAVAGVATAQGWAVMGLLWLVDRSFPLLSVLAQVALVTAFAVAAALFWAVRLRTAGGVWLASLASVAVAGRWFFFDPIPQRLFSESGRWLPVGWDAARWAGAAAVLAGGAVLFTLYARRRLRRPELLLH